MDILDLQEETSRKGMVRLSNRDDIISVSFNGTMRFSRKQRGVETRNTDKGTEPGKGG